MSLQAWGIYHPMMRSTWGGRRLPSVGARAQSKDTPGGGTHPSHRLMSSAGYPWWGALQQSPLRFAGCRHSAINQCCRSTVFQRTAKCVLTICVSPGGKRICIMIVSDRRFEHPVRRSCSLKTNRLFLKVSEFLQTVYF
jgi:hypothetical protein